MDSESKSFVYHKYFWLITIMCFLALASVADAATYEQKYYADGANHWHTNSSDTNNWDSKFDLAGPSFGDPDGYIDVWDLMVFADHWHEGQKP